MKIHIEDVRRISSLYYVMLIGYVCICSGQVQGPGIGRTGELDYTRQSFRHTVASRHLRLSCGYF